MFAKSDTPAQIRGRHQVAQLRGPDARPGPVQLRAAEGRRVPGRLPRAAVVHRRRPSRRTSSSSRPARRSIRPTTRRSSTRTRRATGEPTDAQAAVQGVEPARCSPRSPSRAPASQRLLKAAAANVNTLLANSGGQVAAAGAGLPAPAVSPGASAPDRAPPRAIAPQRSHRAFAGWPRPRRIRRIDDGHALPLRTAQRRPRPAARGGGPGRCCPGSPAQRRRLGFLIGAVLCFAFFSWYPIVREIIMSFQKTAPGRDHMGRGGRTTAGSSMTRRSGQAWRNTLEFTGLALVFGYAVPFVIAIVLNELRHAKRLPAGPRLPAGDAAAGRGAAAVRLLLRPAVPGCSTDILHFLHLPTSQWVLRQEPASDHRDGRRGDRRHLDEHGRATLIYLAALQNIPGELYEAAELDGAGSAAGSGTSRSRRPG